MSWDLSCLQVNQHQPFLIKQYFVKKRNSKCNIKKKTDMGGFAPPQVREKTSKNCEIFLIF